MPESRPVRIYKCSDTILLTAGSVLLRHFITHKADFLKTRTDFADPFAENLQQRIDLASSTNLGTTKNQGPKDATAPLTLQRNLAKEKVQLMKNSLESRFVDNKELKAQYLFDLGLKQHYTSFYDGNDTSARELYLKMNLALSGPLKAELTASGLATILFDEALSSLQPIGNLNEDQEQEKGQDTTITDANIIEFNALYTIFMGIANQGKAIFQKQRAIHDKFVWDIIVSRM